MADTYKPPSRIITNRGFEILLELEKADSHRDLLRCIAEAIAYLETNACSRSKSTDEIEKFRFYEE
ncbi:hypothetical protein LCGC14_2903690 [marine sediment metagenome]|uniref:Uncharacterized protein n=1 Tax=marine sediment metagenome TaxID=412755 RepID=A0A0F9A1G4_9ZZZZ